jgi:hypothetical protein
MTPILQHQLTVKCCEVDHRGRSSQTMIALIQLVGKFLDFISSPFSCVLLIRVYVYFQ